MKCLIAVTPTGGACFVSGLFQGSVDDVKIFRECGILNHIKPGDSLLVDKGFAVQELLLPKQAKLLPRFLVNEQNVFFVGEGGGGGGGRGRENCFNSA